MNRVQIFDLVEKKSSSLKIGDLSKEGLYPVYGASGIVGYRDDYQTPKQAIAIIKDGAGVGRVSVIPAKSSVIGTMQLLIPKDGVDPNYLFFLFSYLKLGVNFSGATIPHIYFKDYGKTFLDYKTSIEQANIGEELSQISLLIDNCILRKEKLNELVDSRFDEMFNNNECHVELLKDYCFFQEGPGVRTADFTKEGTRLLTGTNINNNSITFGHKADRFISNELANGKYAHFMCEKNDILVVTSAIDPARFKEKVVIVEEDKQYCLNTGIIRFKPNLEFLTRRYFIEFLKSNYFKVQVVKNLNGVAQMHFGPSHLKTMKLIVPNSIKKQDEFEAFVIAVDNLKSNLDEQLARLNELLNSKMQSYFGI